MRLGRSNSEEESLMQCSACGTQLPVGTAYCPTCGSVTPYQVSSSGVSPSDTPPLQSHRSTPIHPLILTPLLHQRLLHLHPTVEGSRRGALLSRSSSCCSSSEQLVFSTSERYLPLANHNLTLLRRPKHSRLLPPLPLRHKHSKRQLPLPLRHHRTCMPRSPRALQRSMTP